MKKTIAIELAGLRFHLLLDAYEMLEGYLSAIEEALQHEASAEEIMVDIESRIAELILDKKQGEKEVVDVSDVERIMAAIGAPETFQEGDEDEQPSIDRRLVRRLHRDRDSAFLGGVAAGLGHYFGLDAVWVRMSFILFLIFGGFAIPIYAILWLIVPAAETPAERLRMAGKPVNFDNLKNAVNREVQNAGYRVRRWGRGAGKWAGHGWSTATSGILEFLTFGLRAMGWLVVVGVATGFTVVATILISFLMGVGGLELGGLTIEAGSSLSHAIELVLPTGVDSKWLWLGSILLLSLPLIAFSLLLIRLVFRLDLHRVSWTLALFIGLILSTMGATGLGILATRVGLAFRGEAELERILDLDTESVSLKMQTAFLKEGTLWTTDFRGMGTLRVLGDTIWMDDIDVEIQPTASPNPRIRWITHAHGVNRHQAKMRAQEMSYSLHSISDGELALSDHFQFPMASRYRGQSVDVVLEVPMGCEIFFHPSMASYLRTPRNLGQKTVQEMVGKTWIMTENGLIHQSSIQDL